MKNEIKYVGYYDVLRDGKQYRLFSLAAAKKMDFICDVIMKLGYKVHIISPAYITKSGIKKYKEVSEVLQLDKKLSLTPSCESKNKLKRIYRKFQASWWLFFYLLNNTEKNEPIIVYHNYDLAMPVYFAQRIKKFRIILEIEEIYSKVWKLTRYKKMKEKMLLKYASNNSLLVSEVLAKELNIDTQAVAYGSYSIYDGYIEEKCKKDSIVLVLTGMVDKERGNGFMAVEAMRYLPSKYVLKISGVVAKKDEIEFKNLIMQVNQELGREACVYMGMLEDRAYQELLLEADIALNPQKAGEFGKYVFPSKILTYFSFGLPVVSTKGESILNSKVADLISFSDLFTAKSVAEAILNVQVLEPQIYRNRLVDLWIDFSEILEKIINIDECVIN